MIRMIPAILVDRVGTEEHESLILIELIGPRLKKG